MGLYLEANKEDREKLTMMEDAQSYGYKFYEKDDVVKEYNIVKLFYIRSIK